jgi:hypothetical protein
MAFYISVGILFLIVGVIVYLFIRRQKIEDGISEFYQKNQFYEVKEIPENIKTAIGKGNWVYFKSSLVIDHIPFEFYWLICSVSSTTWSGSALQTTVNYILNIAFPSSTISRELKKKALQLQKSESNAKNFFIFNTDNPTKVEELKDGTLLITWNVLNRADIFQKKMDWLEENLS